MGQKHSRPSRRPGQNQDHLLQGEQNQQNSSQQQQQQQAPQQQPASGYAPSQVYQQSPAAFTNGQYYGGYAAGPYGGAPPVGGHMYQPGPGGHVPRPPVPTQAVKQTQKIKNQVNLMKKTLQLDPSPEDPTLLRLSFSFSATAPCRVSTFVLATEDPSRSLKIIGATSDLRTPAYYDKGVNQHFPHTEALAQQHVIRLVQDGQSKEQPLQTAMGNSYPVVIRLEALAEHAAAEGKQLEELPLGAALPDWVQAQCTYAKLKRDEEDKWVLQVLKQKIWVDGVSYELQEIYGMEATRTAASSVAASSEDIDGRECVICMSAPRNTTVLPCRHMCICDACADELRNRSSKCPICREPMESLLHIKQ